MFRFFLPVCIHFVICLCSKWWRVCVSKLEIFLFVYFSLNFSLFTMIPVQKEVMKLVLYLGVRITCSYCMNILDSFLTLPKPDFCNSYLVWYQHMHHRHHPHTKRYHLCSNLFWHCHQAPTPPFPLYMYRITHLLYIHLEVIQKKHPVLCYHSG